MTNKFENEIQGHALYLEFRKHYATTQVIITPDGFSKTQGVVDAVFFRRTISGGATKRKWRHYTMPNSDTLKTAIQYGHEAESAAFIEKAQARISNLTDYFLSLRKSNFKLVNDTPIYVEVTKDDLELIKAGTMPPKMWSRIKASRASLGFPEETITTLITPV